MNNRIRDWWNTARRRDTTAVVTEPVEGAVAVEPVEALPAPGQQPKAGSRGRHAGAAADAMRQIETEAPLEKSPGGPAGPEHVYASATVRWLWKEYDGNCEQLLRLEAEAFERLELAKVLRDRNIDIKRFLDVAHAPGVVHVTDLRAETAPASRPAPTSANAQDAPEPPGRPAAGAPAAGACVECGTSADTILRMNYQTGKLEPLCPKCDAFYAAMIGRVAAAGTQQPTAPDAALAAAAGESSAAGDGSPPTADAQATEAPAVATGGAWWNRPGFDQALADVEELALLDGVR